MRTITREHTHTLEKIFQHPIAHNVEWRQVRTLLAAVGSLSEEHNGSLRVTINGETHTAHRPQGKDMDAQALIDLRHFFERVGMTPPGHHHKGEPGDSEAEPLKIGDRHRFVQGVAQLTAAQKDQFRARLEEQRNALQAEAADMQRQIADPEAIVDAVSNLGDDGNMLFAREEAMNEFARQEQALAKIERALERLAAGTYGYSEVSGQPIPIERLEALPSATTLVGEHVPE